MKEGLLGFVVVYLISTLFLINYATAEAIAIRYFLSSKPLITDT